MTAAEAWLARDAPPEVWAAMRCAPEPDGDFVKGMILVILGALAGPRTPAGRALGALGSAELDAAVRDMRQCGHRRA